MADLKSTFLNPYSVLKSDIFHDPSFEFTDEFRLWLELVACALIIAGENLKNHVDVKNVLVDIGIYFQVQENYGKSDQSNAAIVKDLFKELDLEEVFMEYGSKTYEKLKQVIEAHQNKTI